MNGKREYGDYQTPLEFAQRVCLYLKNNRNIRPSAVVEPTCGVGNFLSGSLLFDAEKYYGIEINPAYCEVCRRAVSDSRVSVINADFFSFPLKSLIRDKSGTLVIGNPPWATNSALSALNSRNLPEKANFKKLSGMDAITGESNFDICESVILRLIREYGGSETLIAMLCKTSVARNVFQEMKRSRVYFTLFDTLEFDAFKVFGVHASACLMLIQLSEKPASLDACAVYDFDNPEIVKSRFGFSNGRFYSHLDTSGERFEGRCCFEWRQGVKHDCARIMELNLCDGVLRNGKKERVSIEPDCVYPLVKGSMFKSPVIHSFRKFVIVTQRKPREETNRLAREAPKTWEYLNQNQADFQRRKSSIYRNAPPFSMFGIGDYSYARFKVGVSGFYRRPMFSVLYSDDGKPVMTDDTSYFIRLDSFPMAYVAMLLLNSGKVQKFMESISFPDAKRPYTKKILERVDLAKAASSVSFCGLQETERELRLPAYVSSDVYHDFQSLLHGGTDTN